MSNEKGGCRANHKYVLVAGMIAGMFLMVIISAMHSIPIANANDGGGGSTIYVPDDCPTIQQAIDSASDGDTIIVANGTYNEQLIINKNNLSIQSEYGAANTIINVTGQGTSYGGIVFKADGCTFEGFTVIDYSDEKYENKIIRIEGNNNTVKNNIIVGNLNQPEISNQTEYGILFQSTASGNLIENNEIYDIGYIGINIYGAEGAHNNTVRNNYVHDIGIYAIAVDRSPNNTITQNTISNLVGGTLNLFGGGNYYYDSNTWCWGIVVWGANSAGTLITQQNVTNLPNGIVLSSAQNVTIENCNISNNDNYGLKISYTGWVGDRPENNTIINNNICNNKVGIYVTNGTGSIGPFNIIHCNNIYGNTEMGLNNTSPSLIDAKYNWWGSNSGPHDDHDASATLPDYNNSNGHGDNVTAYVDYRPWLNDTTPPIQTIEIGNPKVQRVWRSNLYDVVGPYTPIWINSTDRGDCNCTCDIGVSGSHYITYSVWLAPDLNASQIKWQHLPQYDTTVYDGDDGVTDGKVHAVLYLNETCFHQIRYQCWDYEGYSDGMYSKDLFVDKCPPTTNKTVGCPEYGAGIIQPPWSSGVTPILFKSSDKCCLENGTGVHNITIMVWWKPDTCNISEPTNVIETIVVEDQSNEDLNDTEGIIEYEYHFKKSGFYELEWWGTDNVGNSEEHWKQQHRVDIEPPIIEKTHPLTGYYPLEERNISFLYEDNFEGVDGDTSSWSTGSATSHLNTNSWSLLNGDAEVSAYVDGNSADLTHRGIRGLGVDGGEPDEIDIRNINGAERIEITFNRPYQLSYFEVRSLFAGEEGDVSFWLDGQQVGYHHLVGVETLGSGNGVVSVNVNFSNIANTIVDGTPTIIVDRIVFYIDQNASYAPYSTYAVARLKVKPAAGYLKCNTPFNLDVNDMPNTTCNSGLYGMYWRYEWDSDNDGQVEQYPQPGDAGAVNGADITDHFCIDAPNIDNYWWYPYGNGIQFLSDCQHDVYYFAIDNVGNYGCVQHQVYYVDNVPPIINKTIGEPWHNKSGKLFITSNTPIWVNATDNGTDPCIVGSVHLNVKVYNASKPTPVLIYNKWDNVSDGWAHIGPIFIPKECEHWINITAIDDLGNINWHNETVYVDNTPPIINKTIGEHKCTKDPATYYCITPYTPIWVNATDNSTGPCMVGSVYLNVSVYSFKTGQWTYYENSTDKGWAHIQFTIPEDCKHWINVTARDDLDNINWDNETVYVDNSTPNITIIVGSPNCTISADEYCVTTRTPITFNVTDTGCCKNLTIKWNNGTGWNVIYIEDYPLTYERTFTFNSECHHWLNVTAYDCLGHKAWKNYTFNVDDTPPKINKTVGEPKMLGSNHNPDYYITSNTNITINVTEQGCCNNLTNVSYRVFYQGQWSQWYEITDHIPKNITLSGDCVHYLEIAAEDCLGNRVVDNETFYVDNTPPIINKTIGNPQYNKSGMLFITSHTPIWVNATDNGTDPCIVGSVYLNVSVYSFKTGQWTYYEDDIDNGWAHIQFTIPEDCKHWINVTARDDLGNINWDNETVYVDNIPPIINKTVGEPNCCGLCFDGYDDKVIVPCSDTLNLTDNLTIEAWVIIHSKGFHPIVDKLRSYGGLYSGYRVYISISSSDRKPYLYFEYGNETHRLITRKSSTIMPLNRWTHIAVTFKDGNGAFYIDGSPAGSISGSGNVSTNSGDLGIGYSHLNVKYMKGCINEVRIYNRSLSQSEILKNYQGDVVRDGLVSWWKFNDGGNIAYDLIGRNNGTIYGAHHGVCVTSDTPIWINATDGGIGPCIVGSVDLYVDIYNATTKQPIDGYRVHVDDDWAHIGPIFIPKECEHWINITAIDDLGNTAYHNETFYVDNTPPVINKTVGEPSLQDDNGTWWVTSETPINVTAYDLGCCPCKEVTIQYRIWFLGNWTEWMNYTSNITLSEHCKHYLEIRAFDCLGNMALDNETFIVHDEVGEHPTLVSPECGAVFNGTPITLVWNQVRDYENYRVEWSTDINFTTNVYYANVTGTSYTITSLDDGRWYWHVAIIYTGGTIGDWSSTCYFILDTTAPEIESITSNDDDGVVIAGTTLVLTVKEKNNETGLIGTITITNETGYKVVDSQGLIDNNDGTYYYEYPIPENEQPGVYNVTAVLIDEAGNADNDGLPYYHYTVIPTAGPIIENLTVSPDTVSTGDVTLTATATNTESIISEAEYFINSVGAPGNGRSLDVTDGEWNETTEDINGTIDNSLLSEGENVIYVHAKDEAGNWGPFETAIITKDTTPPTITDIQIIYPTDQHTVREGQTITIKANVTEENIDSVVADCSALGAGAIEMTLESGNTYSCQCTLVNTSGDFDATIHVTATDIAGNSDTDSADVTVDNTPPTAEITSPSDGKVVRGTINVTTQATDNHLEIVELYIGTDLISTSTSSNPSFTIDTTQYPNGEWILTITAYDDAGNVNTSDGVTIIIDNQAPDNAVIVRPDDGEYVSGNVTIEVSAGDAINVSNVTFYCDGSPLGVDYAAPWIMYWNTTSVSDGAHTLGATVFDTAGNSINATNITVYVDNTPPNVTLRANKTTGWTHPISGSLLLNATASDTNGIEKVVFQIKPVGKDERIHLATITVGNNGYYIYVLDTTEYVDGKYYVYAIAYDRAGNAYGGINVAGTCKKLLIDNTPPSITITNPSPGSIVSGIVNITFNVNDAHNIAERYVIIDGAEYPTSNDYYLWDSTTTYDGSHYLMIKAIDEAGNVGYSMMIMVATDNMDESDPYIHIVYPNHGDVIEVNETNRGYLKVKIDASDDKTSKENLAVSLWIPGGRRDAPTLWYPVVYNSTDGYFYADVDIYKYQNGTEITLCASAEDEAGNYQPAPCLNVRILSPVVWDQWMQNGWNRLILPHMSLCDDSVEKVLTSLNGYYDVVFYYEANNSNNNTSGWSSYVPGDSHQSLYTMDPGKEYWIHMNGTETRFYIDDAAPYINITYPVNNSLINEFAQNISGTAFDVMGIAYVKIMIEDLDVPCCANYWNGSAWQTSPCWLLCDGTDYWQYLDTQSINMSGRSGHHIKITAMAVDNLGCSATDTIIFVYDDQPPKSHIDFISPYVNTAPNITGRTEDDYALDYVEVCLNFTNSTGTIYYWNFNSGVWQSEKYWEIIDQTGLTDTWNLSKLDPEDSDYESGVTYYVTAKATDLAGNKESTANISFTYDAIQPDITIECPVDEETYTCGEPLEINGTAGDGETFVDRVYIRIENGSTSLYWNGSAWTTQPVDLECSYADGNWSYRDIPEWEDDHIYIIHAFAEDAAGNVNYTMAQFKYSCPPLG